MDLGDLEGNLPLIIAIIGLILLQFFFSRRRRAKTGPQDIARSLLAEVTLNLALAEIFYAHWRVKRFEIVSWQINKTKIDFLDQPLQTVLSDAFMMAEDLNRQIAAAKKHKLDSYLAGSNTERLKESLSKGQQGLEKWLLPKTGKDEPATKYPGVFDGLLGGR